MNTRFGITLAVIFLIITSSCSPGAAPRREVLEAAPAATEAPAVVREMPVVEMPAAAQSTAAAPAAPSQDFELAPVSLPSSRMIIKDAVLDLLVENPDGAIERVTQLAADQGGYLVSSRVWMEGDYKLAELRMGVPSLSFEDTLNKLRRIAVQVLNEQATGEDVSAQYADLQSRLVNLEATAARVRTFLDQTKNVEESLKINAQLSELEGQIEQVKGQMKFYEGRSAYSTITVLLKPQMPTPTPTLTPTLTPTPTPTPGWNPGKTVKSASKVMVALIQGLIDMLIWGAFLLWPFVLIGVAAWVIFRRFRRKPPRSKPGNEEGESS